MMETRVCYGEYSLKHWVNLVLKRNVVLPLYQRCFVWDEKDIIRLMKSLKDGQFVQPVTVAHYVDSVKKYNILLDGQQRLTSILLAYLGFMPNKDQFDELRSYATADDSEEENIITRKIIGWTFEDLLDTDAINNKVSDIRNRLKENPQYSVLNIPFLGDKDAFFEKTFLGFSYIIPNLEDESASQKYFSTLFRNMNYLGMKLSPLESRRSLYFLNSELENFFDGLTDDKEDILCGIDIVENMQNCKIDIVRYLSTLSQYSAEDRSCKKVLVGYSAYSSRENYYADYVSYIVGLEQEDRNSKFDKFSFSGTFPNHVWKSRYSAIRNLILSLIPKMRLDEKRKAFTSWIDADYWFFGILYFTLFEGKAITIDDKLVTNISRQIDLRRKDKNYCKNTNRLSNLRERMQESIDIYSGYAH